MQLWQPIIFSTDSMQSMYKEWKSYRQLFTYYGAGTATMNLANPLNIPSNYSKHK